MTGRGDSAYGPASTKRSGGRFLLLLALAVACLTGCKGRKSGQDEITRFQARFAGLPEQARTTALLDLTRAGAGRDAVLAHFELGNILYGEAQDSAAASPSSERVASLLDSARVHFASATDLDTTFLQAYVNLGSVLDDLAERTPAMGAEREKRQRLLAESEQTYRRALGLDPNDEKARCNLGALLLKQRKTSEALEQFKTVLAHNPKSALAHYNLAIMFAESKMYREAKREWGAAAAADPRGDIGERSRANIKIIEQMSAPVPAGLQGRSSQAQ